MAPLNLFVRPSTKTAEPAKAAASKKTEKQPSGAGPGARGWSGRGGGTARLVPAVGLGLVVGLEAELLGKTPCGHGEYPHRDRRSDCH